MTTSQKKFDLIVVGAGLVGASFILALQRQGLKIAVLEKHLPDINAMAQAEFRPISLAYGSVQVFRTLGVWPALQSQATAIDEVVVCEEGSLGSVHFSSKSLGVAALGYVVAFATLYHALYQRVLEQEGVEIRAIQRITHIERKDDLMHVFIDTPTGPIELQAPLLVGCDGAQSSVRKLLAMETVASRDTDVAVTAMLTLEKPYHGVALERFTREGAVALLPLPLPNQCGLVMTMSRALWEQREAWLEYEWINLITTQVLGRAPKILAFKKGGMFPLQTIVAKQPMQAGVILLGNAAHTIYPLAAQGFNLGLRDAASLAEILVEARGQWQVLGAATVLQKYLDWRQQDQRAIRRLTTMLTRFFSVPLPGASTLRGLGLLVVDVFSPLKKRLAKMTMGMAGSLPKLVRGLPLWEVNKNHE